MEKKITPTSVIFVAVDDQLDIPDGYEKHSKIYF
jgi:hypothetical protein